MSECRTCRKPIWRRSKTGLCITCFNKDPEASAARIAGLKLAFQSRPELRERQRAHLTALNQTPEARARAGKQAAEMRLWEYGLPALTTEARKKGARTQEERRLGHIPPDYRDLYRELTQKRRLSTGEATELVLSQVETDRERFRNKIGAAA